MRNKKERGNTGDEVLINRKVIQAFSGSGPNEHYWKPSEMRANQYMCAAPVHYDSLRPSGGMLAAAQSQLRGAAERFQDGNALRIECKRLAN